MIHLKKMYWSLIFVAGISLFFTACEKDSLLENEPEEQVAENQQDATTPNAPSTNTNDAQAQGLAAMMGKGSATGSDTTDLEECDCFALFDGIDWESEDWEAIEEEVDAILESMTDEELDALFTPVCIDEEFYPNACVADCNGITGYTECEDEDWGEDWEEDYWDCLLYTSPSPRD